MRLPVVGRRAPEAATEPLLEFLHRVTILQDLAPEDLATVQEMAQEHQFRAGSAIITEGEAGDRMFILTAGTVEISKTLNLETARGEFGTKDKTLHRLRAEDHGFFGEMALLGTDVRTATVTAATDCRALSLSKQDLEHLEQEHLSIAYAIVRRTAEELCRRLRQQNQDVLKLTTALSIALSR